MELFDDDRCAVRIALLLDGQAFARCAVRVALLLDGQAFATQSAGPITWTLG